MDHATPQPGDLLLTRNGHSSIFIHRVTSWEPARDREWIATSSTMLEQRGISRPHQPGSYQPAPDFTIGRIFDKGQARHLIGRYLPELVTDLPCPECGCEERHEGTGTLTCECPFSESTADRPRILLRREFGWELDVTKPAMKPGKARKATRSRF